MTKLENSKIRVHIFKWKGVALHTLYWSTRGNALQFFAQVFIRDHEIIFLSSLSLFVEAHLSRKITYDILRGMHEHLFVEAHLSRKITCDILRGMHEHMFVLGFRYLLHVGSFL